MNVIDWTSVKLLGVSSFLAAITWNGFVAFLTGLAFASTLIYNGIRIYKELKNKNANRN